MKKILTVLFAIALSVSVFGQYDLNVTPDTIPDGGSRQDLRQAVNWSLMKHNAGLGTFVSADTIASLSNDPDEAYILLKDRAIEIVADNNGYEASIEVRATGGGILVTDNASDVGLVGDQYFSNAGGNNAFVQARYVDEAIAAIPGGGGEYLAGSGLTLDVSTFRLDGAMTQDAIITNDGTAYDFKIEGSDGSAPRSGYFAFSGGTPTMTAFNAANYAITGGYADVKVQGNTATVQSVTSGYTPSSLKISNASMLITDAINGVGLIYAGNYDAVGSLDDDWIPSYRQVKAYADGVSGGAPGGANTNIQFNNSGVFGGSNDFAWNNGTKALTVNGDVVISTTTGTLVPPRMNTTQREATIPVNGSVVYDLTVGALFSYRNSTWGQLASGTPVDGGDVLVLKSDWHNFTFALGNGNTGDDAVFVVGAECGVWKESRAVSVPEEFELVMEGSGADMTVQLFYGADPTGAGTAICSPLGVATVGGMTTSTTFLVSTIPAGNYIWCEITAVTGAPLKFRGSFSFSFE